MKKIILLFVVAGLMTACQKDNKTKEIGERFFKIYSERSEIDKMISFYAPDFHYENVSFQSEAQDPKFLYENFYNWKDPNFRFSGKETIKVDEILSNDSVIVAKGTTMPYSYNGKEVNGTRFVIWLELDKNLKIKKQTDWFDYPMSEIIEAYYLKQNMKIE